MSMREKIARALAGNAWVRCVEGDAPFIYSRYPDGRDQYCNERWRLYLQDADAVLDVLMEPTRMMADAGRTEIEDWGFNIGSKCFIPSDVFCAMIQAARDGK